jgi:multiple antibiotic resistance protein
MSAGLFLNTVLLTVSGLLPIVNPFSVAPLFVSLTSQMPAQVRARQAMLASLYGFAILVVFLLLGSAIVSFFGISVAGIRVAGGVIIAIIGLRMLFPQPAASHGDAANANVAFTPIAMPALCGPGAISIVISSAAHINSRHGGDPLLTYAAVIVGIAATLIISFAVLRLASGMVRFLGHSGIDAMTRIFGFLLICIGTQFLLTGIADFYAIHTP